MEPIVILRPGEPLPEIQRALKRAYPKAGIVAVGIGRRRRRGRLLDEVTIKVVLRRKRKDVAAELRLPRRLPLVLRFLGRKLRLTVSTDIEARPAAQTTRYRVGPLPPNDTDQVVGAYARWQASDRPHYGVVTAGHGLWNEAHDTRLETARVHLSLLGDPGPRDLPVRAASHLRDDGVDVGLLEIEAATLPEDFASLWSKVHEPDVVELNALLGSSSDASTLDSTFLLPGQRRHATTVAYYPRYQSLPVGGWGLVTLLDVVESEGAADTFVGGTSGAGLVARRGRRYALGVQSLCLDPGPGGGRLSLGTSFARACAYLSSAVGSPVDVFWHRDDVQVGG